MFALPISMLRFKNVAVIFIKIALKLIYSILAKKCKIFKHLGLRPQTPLPPAARDFDPRPPVSDSWGLFHQTPKTATQLRISGYAPDMYCFMRENCINYKNGFVF